MLVTGQRKADELDMADFWIAVNAYDLIESEKARLRERREKDNRRVRFRYNLLVRQKLLAALESPEFPGPLFVRRDQVQPVRSDEELRNEWGIPQKLYEQLRSSENFRKRIEGAKYNRDALLQALNPDDVHKLRKELRKRLYTPPNLYKRLQALGLIEEKTTRPKKRLLRRRGTITAHH